jgi:hypothetical protein
VGSSWPGVSARDDREKSRLLENDPIPLTESLRCTQIPPVYSNRITKFPREREKERERERGREREREKERDRESGREREREREGEREREREREREGDYLILP